MTYQDIEKLNAARSKGLTAYNSKQATQKRRSAFYNAIWSIIVLGFFLASIQAIQLRSEVQDITQQQQTQAIQHADDRIWYQTSCVPSTFNPSKVSCTPNPELTQ